MKTKLTLLLVFFLLAVTSLAQRFTVTGRVINDHDKQSVELATVRLLTPDSALVTGTFTDSIGNFTLHTERSGNFLLVSSYVGFRPASADVRLMLCDTVDVGTLRMMSDDIALRSALVSTTLARVEQKEDTTMFNAGAYRVPDGATLEALVKQFPGIEITDDGKIKWNGKEVKEFLVNGKDFFKGETDVAMKNLPANYVRRVKAYDKKSDYTEQTGIDDGEETTVLDIMTKHELNQSLVSNFDLAAGWDWHDHALYSGKFFASHFSDQSRVTAYASRNNIGDAGFGGPRGMGGGNGGNGLTTSTMAGFDFNWDNGRKRFEAGRVEVGGNVNYRGRNNESESTNSTMTFLSDTDSRSYSNSHSWGTSKSHNVSTSLRLMWSPDSLTSISFRPSWSWSKNESTSRSRSAQFDSDPFAELPDVDSTDDVLDAAFCTAAPSPSWLVNRNQRHSLSENSNHSLNANLNTTRRLTGKAGRNVSLQASGGWSKSQGWSYSLSDIYSRHRGDDGTTSLLPNGTHQFTMSPSLGWNASLGGSYVEPLRGKWYGELRYSYSHRFQDADRTQYDLLDRDPSQTLASLIKEHPEYTTFYQLRDNTTLDGAQALLSLNPDEVYAAVRDEINSRYSTYHYNNQRASLGVRYNTPTVNFNASLSLNPEHTMLHYDRPGLFPQPLRTTRNVITLSPQVRFRYNFSKTNRMELFYRGNSAQPSMTDLLPVVDTSNPLRITAGNPALSPSWTDSFRFNFNAYNATRQAGTALNASFTNSRRSITTRQVTDLTSGVGYSRPENISGNWSARGGVMYNVGLGVQKLFTLSTSTDLSFDRTLGYSSSRAESAAVESDYPSTFDFMTALFADMGSTKTSARTTGVSENLNLAFRRSLWDVSANARMNYRHSATNALNASSMDTWGYAYGITANLTLDCGLSFSTDLRMNSRRGYSERAMNTNELIWNAQISQSFLRAKALTLQLQFYDILQQQSNISRTVSALSRSDAWHDAVNSYFLLHVIYKLNVFRGTHATRSDDNPLTLPPAYRPNGAPVPSPSDRRGPGNMGGAPRGAFFL